jgi:hypothetical protein
VNTTKKIFLATPGQSNDAVTQVARVQFKAAVDAEVDVDDDDGGVDAEVARQTSSSPTGMQF